LPLVFVFRPLASKLHAWRVHRMKKTTYFAGITFAALLMLLPVISRVNHTFGKTSVAPVSVADGCPLPPPIPTVTA